MALTELFMSFNRVGQLYYRLANLLKVCASNLMLNTSNLRYREIIYSVQGGLQGEEWCASHRLECTNKFTRNNNFLITSSGFMEMGYKYYNLHYNLAHALLQL